MDPNIRVGILNTQQKTSYGSNANGVRFYLFTTHNCSWLVPYDEISKGNLYVVAKYLFKKGRQEFASLERVIGVIGTYDVDLKYLMASSGIDDTKFPFNYSMLSAGRTMERANFLKHEVYTIDGVDCFDRDDAFSLQPNDDGTFELGIHITDASECIVPGSALDLHMRKKFSSLYLLESLAVNMMPEELIRSHLSLDEGCVRPVLSIIFTIDPTSADVIDTNIVHGIVSVTHNLCYDNIPDVIRSKLNAVFEWTELIYQSGVLGLEDGSAGAAFSPQIMINILMVLANKTIAEFMVDNMPKTLLRVNPEPCTDAVLHSDIEAVFKYRQNKMNSRSSYVLAGEDDKPYHSMINLPYYTHFTSPIRRYTDLVVHRMVKSLLLSDDPIVPNAVELEYMNQVSTGHKRFYSSKKVLDFAYNPSMPYNDRTIDAIYVEYVGTKIILYIPEYEIFLSQTYISADVAKIIDFECCGSVMTYSHGGKFYSLHPNTSLQIKLLFNPLAKTISDKVRIQFLDDFIIHNLLRT
jgi:hypothetical protein